MRTQLTTVCLVMVVWMEFTEIRAHNIQQISVDSNNTDVILQAISFEDYPEKVRLDPGGTADLEPEISCSEWCCRRNARRRCQRNNNSQTVPQIMSETPPPSYDLFAPPAYEDLWGTNSGGRSGEKRQFDIYVVPVHALDNFMEDVQRHDAPPSYQSASATQTRLAELPLTSSSTVNEANRIT
ncbi:uncharacterized protein [Euwallacea fornicatus]|uniref:uncharacterized protein isoform X2 n=1 Tax=Euwallacea fornicatus TaxID=995702 RepID=UPI00338E7634